MNPGHAVLGDFGQNHGLGRSYANRFYASRLTTPFSLLVDIDSNHLHLCPIHRNQSGKVPVVGMAKILISLKTVNLSQLLVSVPVATLTHFDHHQGGICKHFRLFKQKSKL